MEPRRTAGRAARVAKSIGHEETFPTDVTELATLEHEVVRLADSVASRLRAAGRAGRTVQLKVRYAGFRTITRSRTLREPTDLAADIAAVAARASSATCPSSTDGIRLLGVSMQQLSVPAPPLQPDLFGPEVSPRTPTPRPGPASAVSQRPERQALERTVDAVRARFGHDAVGPGASRVEQHTGRAREWGCVVGDSASPGQGSMPLSEDEQRILNEIEENLSATDPKLVQQVSDTTLYRHAARVIKWSVVGFIAGLLLMIFTFTTTLILGIVGFVVMLGCALAIEHNVRKLGRAGFESLTSSMRSGALKNMLGNAGSRWRERWGRDDPPS